MYSIFYLAMLYFHRFLIIPVRYIFTFLRIIIEFLSTWSDNRLLCVFCLLLSISLTSCCNRITIEPYLQNVGEEHITIMWKTSKESQSRVDYGITQDLNLFALDEKKVDSHEITLSRLKPKTLYYYKISSGISTKEGTFFTGVDYDAPFRFAVYGDSRSIPDMHKKIVQGILVQNPDFILHVGDIVSDGLKGDKWEKQFFKPLSEVIAHIPIFPSLGNHEKNSEFYFRYFSLPNNESWYSFDYGNSHFVALDSNSPYKRGSKQYRWLKQDLRKSKAQWKFVFFHHPPYNSGTHKSMLSLRDALTPLFRKYGVDMVFSGHAHTYERTYPIKAFLKPKSHPTTYIVTGGGGAKLHKITPGMWTASSALIHHFCSIEIAGDDLTFTAFDKDYKILDKFSINKSRGQYQARELVRGSTPDQTGLNTAQARVISVMPHEHIEFERRMPGKIKPPELGFISSEGVKNKRATVRLKNIFPGQIQFEIVWDELHNWQIEPPKKSLRVKKGKIAKIPFTFSTQKIYPVPTFTVKYKTEFGEGEIKGKPIKVAIRKELRCKYTSKPPKLDGKLKEKFWRTADVVGDFVKADWRKLALKKTIVRAAYGDDGIYFAIVCYDDSTDELHAKSKKRDNLNPNDDILTILIAPKKKSVYQFAVNCKHIQSDARNGNKRWNGRWETAIHVNENNWTAEVTIPYGVFDLTGSPQTGERWRVNFQRHLRKKTGKSEWTPTFGEPFADVTLGVLIIAKD